MNNFENNQFENITSIPAEVTPEKLAVPTAPAVAPEVKERSEDDVGIYRHVFTKPAFYNGKEVTEITFNWDELTGQDSLNITAELQKQGKTVLSPAFSDDFKMLMAARASNPRVGSDFFPALSMTAFQKILGAARNFLLRGE